MAVAVADLDEIEELADAGCHYRPIRHHLGITAFGVTAWSARAAGERVINEHDEDDPSADQELFLVLRGHAVFEVDGERVDAPAGTLVSAPPAPRVSLTPSRTARPSWRSKDPRRGVRGSRLGAVGPSGPAIPERGVRRGRRPAGCRRHRASAVPDALLQPRLLREPMRSDRGGDRSPPPGHRDVGGVPPVGTGGLRPGPDPRRAGLRAPARGRPDLNASQVLHREGSCGGWGLTTSGAAGTPGAGARTGPDAVVGDGARPSPGRAPSERRDGRVSS